MVPVRSVFHWRQSVISRTTVVTLLTKPQSCVSITVSHVCLRTSIQFLLSLYILATMAEKWLMGQRKIVRTVLCCIVYHITYLHKPFVCHHSLADDVTIQLLLISDILYGLRGDNALWFMCWFWQYINCLIVCLLNFLLPFLLSLCFLSYLVTSLLVCFPTYLSTPSRIDPFRFQAGDWLGITSPKWPVLCRWDVKPQLYIWQPGLCGFVLLMFR